jgi:osmotically-inducible protein OsmY
MSPYQQASATLTRPNPFAVLFQEIEEIAQAALRRSAYFELRNVSCDFSGGVLTLRGRVPTYYLKQLAQASVADVPGVIEVHNRVEVTTSREANNSGTGWKEHDMLASA